MVKAWRALHAGDVEAGIARSQRGQSGQRGGLGDARRRRRGGLARRRSGLGLSQVFRLAADATAQHRVELEQHHCGDRGQDDEFDDLHR